MLSKLRVLATAILLAVQAAPGAERPDVVVIVAERLDDPAFLAWKQNAVMLAECRSGATEAAVAAAVLSGRHEFRCGVTHGVAGRSLIRPDVVLLPELLRAAGYETGAVGKWPLGDNLPCRPEDRGFQHVAVHHGDIGHTGDRWGNRSARPWMRHREGWKRHEGNAAEAAVAEALRFLGARGETVAPRFLWVAPAGEPERLLATLPDLFDAVGAEALVVMIGARAGENGTVPCFIRLPGGGGDGRMWKEPAATMDLLPTILAACDVPLPDNWDGDGVNLLPRFRDDAEVSAKRLIFQHPGGWPGDESPDRHRSSGFAVRDDRWLLQGLELFEPASGERRNLFDEHPDEAARLLAAYGRWWEEMRPFVREPVRQIVGDARQERVRLSAHSWWPARDVAGAVSAPGAATQAAVRRTLVALAEGSPPVPETAGMWKLQVAEEGHYEIALSLLPPEAEQPERGKLGRLKAGTVRLRVGKHEVQGRLQDGMIAVRLGVDLDAGEADLEAWFTGQLGGDRVLSPFFAEIRRVGPRKVPRLDLELRSDPQ